MYYKVMKDNKVIDVLDRLSYVKYQPKHKIMLLCNENEAQAILSSDQSEFWHERTLYEVPDDGPHLDTVDLVEIDRYEYRQLKMLNCKTPEEIADEVILSLIESGII